MDFIGTIGNLFGNFGVTWYRLAGQLVTFAVLMIGLRIFLYKPMLSMLEERKAKISQGLKDAEEAARARAQAQAEAAEQLKAATRKAEELLEQATKSAAKLKDEVMAQTQEEIARLRAQQEEQLAQHKQQMLSEIRGEVANLVVTTTEKLMRQNLTADDQKKLAAQAVKELS